MKQYTIGEYLINFDKNITETWYKKSEGWECDCKDCQNFLALAKQKQLPSEIIGLLSFLGAFPEKPTYVCKLYSNDNEHLYQFNYRIAGNIVSDFSVNNSTEFNWGSISLGYEHYPYGAPDFPEPYFDLMFFVYLPWIIDK